MLTNRALEQKTIFYPLFDPYMKIVLRNDHFNQTKNNPQNFLSKELFKETSIFNTESLSSNITKIISKLAHHFWSPNIVYHLVNMVFSCLLPPETISMLDNGGLDGHQQQQILREL